jgi:hypothetical protein
MAPDRLQNRMRRALILLLLVVFSAKADVLFRDDRQGHGYIFESDQKDVEETVSRDEVIGIASDWAQSFYQDESLDLEVADIELRTNPLRFWLVTLKKAGTDEAFYAVVLPDGTVVEPQDEERI